MSKPTFKAAPLTLDEITAIITDIARDPESGPDRFRALKMLASTSTAAAILPEPMQPGEIVERLARLMKASGRDHTQAAYHRAFPHVSSAAYSAPKYALDDFPPEIVARVQKVRSLKSLYRNYPEVKRPGFPPGYPVRRGPAVVADWCRKIAAKCELDRMQEAANATEASGRVRDEAIRGDAPPPALPTPAFTPAPETIVSALEMRERIAVEEELDES